jgi:hypothetical protein
MLGTDGFDVDTTNLQQPEPDHALKTGTIGYHLRTGKHDVTDDDWQQYLTLLIDIYSSKATLIVRGTT